MKIKHIKTYKFNELKEDIKGKVIDRFRDFNDDWYEDDLEFIKDDLLNEYGIEVKGEVYFDFFRERYLYFTDGFVIDNIKFIKAINKKHTALEFLDDNFKFNDLNKIEISVKKNNLNYIIVEDCQHISNFGYGLCNRCDFLGELADKFSNFLKEILDEYLSNLIKQYANINSDEYIIELIENNDYNFLENGDII